MEAGKSFGRLWRHYFRPEIMMIWTMVTGESEERIDLRYIELAKMFVWFFP